MIATAEPETISPSEADILLAQESDRKLSHFLIEKSRKRGQPYIVQIQSSDGIGETISVPASAFRLLVDILSEMSKGNAITVIPTKAELTTQQAADLLNVSRPFLVGLLEQGEIPFKKVGTHRRIEFSELLKFKEKRDEKRASILDKLASDAQEQNMGY